MNDDYSDDSGLEEPEHDSGIESDPTGFGLKAPQAELSNRRTTVDREPPVPMPAPPPSDENEKSKRMAWKGFEPEEEYEPEVEFMPDKDIDEEMDMTPMVDVTFLLLIFFMVTASFVTQRSLQQPKPSEDLPSTHPIDDPEDQDDYVEIIIDQNNTYRITSRDEEEIEAPSDPEMRAQMRDAKERLNARKLIVTAHEECWHEKVVKAWDYGTTLGFEHIELKTTSQNY